MLLSDLDDISYGTGNDDTKKIEYVSVTNSDGASLYYLKGIRIKNGLTIQNGKINFSTEIYDPESMDYKATENNYFVVEQNDEKSIYSIRGEKLEVLDTSEDYKSILTHTYGDGLIGFESNGKYGYMDLSGKVYIKPIFDYIEPFNDGKAKVKHSFDMCIDEYNGHYERNVETLIINKQRKVISRKLQWYYGREMDNYDIDGFDSWASYRDTFEDDSTAEWGRE